MSELEIYKGMMKNMKLSDNTPYLKKIEENSKYLLNSKLISDTEWEEYQTLKKQVKMAIEKLKEHKYDLDYEPWSIYEVSGNILFDLKLILNGDFDLLEDEDER